MWNHFLSHWLDLARPAGRAPGSHAPPAKKRRQSASSPSRGQGLVEYALIIVLVSVVVIVVLLLLGDEVQAIYCNIVGTLGGGGGPNSPCASPVVACALQQSGGTIRLEAQVTDPDGSTITDVRFYLDGSTLINTEYNYRYCLNGGDASCNTYTPPGGVHTFRTVATDSDGNTGECTVTVIN